MSEKKPSFIVDLSASMVISKISEDSNVSSKGQILYCKCGNVQRFKGKLVRNVIKNYDELTEDSESLKSITCTSCNRVYDNLKKLYLLEPNLRELYSVDYALETKEEESGFIIKRLKGVVEYSSSKDSLIFSKSVDILEVDLLKKQSIINLSTPSVVDVKSIDGVSKSDESKAFDVSSSKVDITNAKILEEFFAYSDSINYSGFENILQSLNLIKVHIKDLDKFDSVYFIDFIKSKSKIELEKSDSGSIEYYQNLDSGFGDGKIVKKKLNLGDYLFNSMNGYKLLLSVLSFESASCIIHTKGYNFFKMWSESNYIQPPRLYIDKKATNPHSIMELSMREAYDKHADDSELSRYLKISSTIYNSIKLMSHMDTLNKAYHYKLTSKNQLEFLLQNYEIDRVYSVLSSILKNQRTTEDVSLEFKNIKHILDNKIDEGHDYVVIYIDTLRVVDLLEVKVKVLFKCKNYNQLKELHDDYSARYNAMKDAKKSEFYSKSVSDFIKLNTQIGDVKFEIVETAERLNLEGLQMHHCIYTYLNRICEKKYIAINVTHLITKERATAGFVRVGDKLQLEQLKGYYNSRATKELIDSTLMFCDEKKIDVKSTYSSDMSPSKDRQRMMPGQMSEEELFKIRKKELNNSKDSKDSEESLKSDGKGVVTNFIKKIFK
jgi:hypothetical protein